MEGVLLGLGWRADPARHSDHATLVPLQPGPGRSLKRRHAFQKWILKVHAIVKPFVNGMP